MAQRALRPCKHCGCTALTRDKSGYCEAHKAEADERKREAWRASDQHRGSARERGYTKQWEKVRAMKLSRDPLCEDCEREGRYIPAKEVHHIIKVSVRPDLRLVMDNLMSLCTHHHSIRTRRGE
jgi:5-methylcytosine-specific restriction protein A